MTRSGAHSATNQRLATALAEAKAALDESRMCLALAHQFGFSLVSTALEARVASNLEAYAAVADELVARNTR